MRFGLKKKERGKYTFYLKKNTCLGSRPNGFISVVNRTRNEVYKTLNIAYVCFKSFYALFITLCALRYCSGGDHSVITGKDDFNFYFTESLNMIDYNKINYVFILISTDHLPVYRKQHTLFWRVVRNSFLI